MSAFGPGALFFILPFAQLLAFIGLIALVVVAARARRPDPHGRRPFAIYLHAVMFTSVFTIMIAMGILGGAVAQAATDRPVLGDGRECSIRQLTGPEGMAPSGASYRAAMMHAQQVAPPVQVPTGRPSRILPPQPDFNPPDFNPPDFNQDDFPRGVEECRSTSSASGAALASMIMAIVAGAAFVFHYRQAQGLIQKERYDDRA